MQARQARWEMSIQLLCKVLLILHSNSLLCFKISAQLVNYQTFIVLLVAHGHKFIVHVSGI